MRQKATTTSFILLTPELLMRLRIMRFMLLVGELMKEPDYTKTIRRSLVNSAEYTVSDTSPAKKKTGKIIRRLN
jgi:hypothetical protein